MPSLLPIRLLPVALALALSACGSGSADATEKEAPRTELALFTSLPIYWGEGEIGALIDGEGEVDWTRALIEQSHALTPLDALEPDTLAGKERLLMVQPRPLAPSENVALDDWVRAGGEVLLFADPLLTRHTDMALGDPRRPQDMVVLSPILSRWGLELRFDAEQGEAVREVDALGMRLPTAQAGFFARVPGDTAGDCTLAGDGLVAMCAIGEGRVLLVADAALLDEDSGVARNALQSLLSRAFAD